MSTRTTIIIVAGVIAVGIGVNAYILTQHSRTSAEQVNVDPGEEYATDHRADDVAPTAPAIQASAQGYQGERSGLVHDHASRTRGRGLTNGHTDHELDNENSAKQQVEPSRDCTITPLGYQHVEFDGNPQVVVVFTVNSGVWTATEEEFKEARQKDLAAGVEPPASRHGIRQYSAERLTLRANGKRFHEGAFYLKLTGRQAGVIHAPGLQKRRPPDGYTEDKSETLAVCWQVKELDRHPPYEIAMDDSPYLPVPAQLSEIPAIDFELPKINIALPQIKPQINTTLSGMKVPPSSLKRRTSHSEKTERINFGSGKHLSALRLSAGKNELGMPKSRMHTATAGHEFVVVEAALNLIGWPEERVDFLDERAMNIQAGDIVLEAIDGKLHHTERSTS